MGEEIELIKALAIECFPKLSEDINFEISSPQDGRYNCIAWAYCLYKDKWMQHDTTPHLDGVIPWWPKGAPKNSNIDSYIDAFKMKGYTICNSPEFEIGYIKIALYIDILTNDCTHASRQKTNGTWMSKLGQWHDIIHSNPSTLEGEAYGKVYCIMKIEF